VPFAAIAGIWGAGPRDLWTAGLDVKHGVPR